MNLMYLVEWNDWLDEAKYAVAVFADKEKAEQFAALKNQESQAIRNQEYYEAVSSGEIEEAPGADYYTISEIELLG